LLSQGERKLSIDKRGLGKSKSRKRDLDPRKRRVPFPGKEDRRFAGERGEDARRKGLPLFRTISTPEGNKKGFNRIAEPN